MCAIKIRYESYMDEPVVRELCLNCQNADCEGICDDYRNAVRTILGLKPLKAHRPRPEKVNHRKKHDHRPYQPRKRHEINGVSHTLSEWANISGIAYNTLYMRMHRYGMSLEEAMGDPLNPIMHDPMTVTVNGETLTISQWAKRLGVQPGAIYGRLSRGYSPEEAVTMERMQ